MTRETRPIFILSVVILLLIGLTAYLALQLHRQNASVEWETYHSQTDILFEKLAEQHQTEKEGRIITGLVGIPWAEGEDDLVDNNTEMPAKRMLHVLLDDETDAFVVSYYAPNVKGTGFAGVFRQYPTDEQQRMLSSSTSYVPGMIISTFVFPKNEEKIDNNSMVEKELALVAEIQTILEVQQ
jgi:hypothetical protein